MPSFAALTIAQFEGPDARMKAERELIARALEELVPPPLAQTWERTIGPEDPAQSLCERRGTHLLVFGRASEHTFDAYLVVERADSITHVDRHSHDVTTVRRRGRPSEPRRERIRLAPNSFGELRQELEAFTKAYFAYAEDLESAEHAVAAALGQISEVRDVLIDQIYCHRADLLVALDRHEKALEVLEERIETHESPHLLRAAAHALSPLPLDTGFRPSADAETKRLDLLRRAARFEDDPDHATDLYNLAIALPPPDVPADTSEIDDLLERVRRDPTYRRAWWIERLRGALEYSKAVHARAVTSETNARRAFSDASAHYSRAIRLRHLSKRQDVVGPAAPRRMPRSPVLHANAYDAHHYAGHHFRAWWHHRRAHRLMWRLFRIGVEALERDDPVTAALAFARVATVGWEDETSLRALVLASVALLKQGDRLAAAERWQAAISLNSVKAWQFRQELVAGGAPLDNLPSDEILEQDEGAV
jgi:tetratricopeptide (TPR) repeat protein